jgi:ribosomal protein S12 methylthiotransferase accessory factor
MIDVERLPRTTASNYHPARPILWVEGLELGSDRSTWVPYELVHTNFSLPLPQGSGAFLMSSNGLASGNTRVEALSHAICEVIERDALTLFSVGGGLERTELRVRTETIDDPDCQRLLALLERAEVSCGIWDITSDVGIASFLCVIVDRAANSFRQLYAASGSGCHPAREIALLRAITEAAQCRLTFISGARDDADRDFFERARRPSHVAEVRRQIQAAPEGTRSYADIPTCHHGAFLDDVAWEVECLRAAGLTEIVAVDLTKPEFNVPVMRVVVPGLESLHNAPGFLPGARAREVLSGGRQ